MKAGGQVAVHRPRALSKIEHSVRLLQPQRAHRIEPGGAASRYHTGQQGDRKQNCDRNGKLSVSVGATPINWDRRACAAAAVSAAPIRMPTPVRIIPCRKTSPRISPRVASIASRTRLARAPSDRIGDDTIEADDRREAAPACRTGQVACSQFADTRTATSVNVGRWINIRHANLRSWDSIARLDSLTRRKTACGRHPAARAWSANTRRHRPASSRPNQKNRGKSLERKSPPQRAGKPNPVPFDSAADGTSLRVTIIPQARPSPEGSRSPPGDFGRAVLGRLPIWPCSVRGFACHRCCHRRGALLPHLFTLACLQAALKGCARASAVCFLCH